MGRTVGMIQAMCLVLFMAMREETRRSSPGVRMATVVMKRRSSTAMDSISRAGCSMRWWLG